MDKIEVSKLVHYGCGWFYQETSQLGWSLEYVPNSIQVIMNDGLVKVVELYNSEKNADGTIHVWKYNGDGISVDIFNDLVQIHLTIIND